MFKNTDVLVQGGFPKEYDDKLMMVTTTTTKFVVSYYSKNFGAGGQPCTKTVSLYYTPHSNQFQVGIQKEAIHTVRFFVQIKSN